MHYRAMYRQSVHKKGTLKAEVLNAVQIGNEYDLQRMLYSILLPIFPTLRQEVYSDNGYGGMRAEIIYFFVYDKTGIIKNPEAFKQAFAREQEKDGKTVKMFILQAKEL